MEAKQVVTGGGGGRERRRAELSNCRGLLCVASPSFMANYMANNVLSM